MVKYTIKTLNEIIKLYSNAENNIGNKDYPIHYKALSRYLFNNGLIKKTRNISKATKFLTDFEKDIESLKYSELVDINQVLWQLQTGDIIPISELIYIDKLSLPVHLIELIEKQNDTGATTTTTTAASFGTNTSGNAVVLGRGKSSSTKVNAMNSGINNISKRKTRSKKTLTKTKKT